MSGQSSTLVADAPAGAAAPRTARKRRARWAVAALVAVVLIAAGVIAWPMVAARLNPAPAAVAAAAAESGRLVVTASADGVAEPAETTDVYAEVGGTVESVEVEVGDRVKAGDELFTVDDADLADAVDSARAQLLQAKQQVASANQQVASANQQVEQAEYGLLQAENRLDALESQTGTRAATAAEIDEAEKNVEVATLGVQSAKAGLTSAKAGLTSAKTSRSNAQSDYDDALADLEKVTVTAPSSGIVTAVNVSEGGSVSGGGSSSSAGGQSGTAVANATGATTSASSGSSAAVVIADPSELTVTVAVNEVDIAEVKAGQEATVTFEAVDDLQIAGKVTWVSPNAESDGSVSTYDVEITLAEQDERLRSGMTATADIVTIAVDDAVLVPKSSVKVDGTTKYVTVVAADGSTEKRTVTTGPSDDTQVQIVSGVTAGEQIATTATSSDEQQGGGFMPPSPGGMGGGRALNGAPSGAPAGMGGGN